jgi:hypothetical protein
VPTGNATEAEAEAEVGRTLRAPVATTRGTAVRIAEADRTATSIAAVSVAVEEAVVAAELAGVATVEEGAAGAAAAGAASARSS